MGGEAVPTDAEQASLNLVRSWREQVNATAGQFESPRINELLVQELEQLKFAISARQIELTAHAVQVATARLAGQVKDPAAVARRVTGRAIALGRRRHPIAGARLVHQAVAITNDMPQVLAAMRAGTLGETQAAILVRETDELTGSQRARVIEEVRPRWSLLGDTDLGQAARGAAARIAPEQVSARHLAAVAGRHVSFRSAPDAMLRLSALLPLKDGLACAQALQAAADAAQNAPATSGSTPRALTGPPRQRWRQAQADALTARLTGTEPAALDAAPVGVAVNLLMPLDTLIGDGDAHLEGYGTITGEVARDLIDACPKEAGPQMRRLFTHPDTGHLVAMESSSRAYTGLLRAFVVLRDQRCRTPWCGSPIRHIDHIRPVHAGGETTAGNGQGGCERCNYDKELPGYTVTGTADRTTHTIGLLSIDSSPPLPPGEPSIVLPPTPPRRPPRVRQPAAPRPHRRGRRDIRTAIDQLLREHPYPRRQ